MTEDMTIRERLARIIAMEWYKDFDFSLMEYENAEAYADAKWPEFLGCVDKQLAVLKEPTEGIVSHFESWRS